MSEVNRMRNEDKRDFFRIDDEVNLVYKKIDVTLATEPSHVTDDILGNFSLFSVLRTISKESASLLNRLERSQPEVTDYLRLVDNKVDLIAQTIIMQDSRLKVKNTRNVNLSAGGVGFYSEQKLEKGDFLEIKILLVTSMVVIVTYGEVVYCKSSQPDDNQHPYFIGVEYVNMKDQDRELLIKHVSKRQLQQIRDQREGGNRL